MGVRFPKSWLRAAKKKLIALCGVVMLAAVPNTQAEEERSLVLGIFPRYDAAEAAGMYMPLANYLSQRLNKNVKVIITRDFDSFWRGLEGQKYDIVHFNQYHYTLSAKNYRIIGTSQEFGRSMVSGAIFVRKDSGINSIHQLKGRTVIFGGGKDAMMSYIAPRYLMMQAGIRDVDFKTEFANNPPNAVMAVYHKQADAAGGGDILIDLAAVRNAINANELKVLATTEPIRFLPWAVKRSMPSSQREAIQSILNELDKSSAGKGILKSTRTTAIVKADDDDYAAHRRMIDAVFGPRQFIKW